MWNKVARVIEYSQEMAECNIHNLQREWEINKEFFLAVTNGEPIIEVEEPITIPMDAETREKKLRAFCEMVSCSNAEMGYFLQMNFDGLNENKVIHEFHTEEGEVIPPGIKIGKALGRYFPNCSESFVFQIQNELSRLIQETKITGKLCLSVHPLDFLSSSENNHGWRSCHALDGEYRAGNLSYMTDSCTFIAYLKSDKEDCKLPRFPSDVPWNDKKWRCLFHVDTNNKMLWMGRHYPMRLDGVVSIVEKVLSHKMNFFESPVLENKLWSSFFAALNWRTVVQGEVDTPEGEFYVNPTVFIRETARPLFQYVKDVENPLHFNDILRSSVYKPQFSEYGFKSGRAVKAMVVGHSVLCPCCGERFIESSEAMMCDTCLLENTDYVDGETIVRCAECGERIMASSAIGASGEYFCQYCADTVLTRCHSCDILFHPQYEGVVTPHGAYCDQCRP